MRRRSFLAVTGSLALPALGSDTLEAFGLKWTVPLSSDWRVANEDGVETLHLATARPLQSSPRKPFQYALAQTERLAKFTLEAEVRRVPAKNGSLIVVYAWEDQAHFNYVHISGDSATEQPVHNGVFHVYSGDRVRISSDKGPCALPSEGWHGIKVIYDSSSGLVETWMDGKLNPSLRAADLSLGPGLVGLGSFFNTGSFRRVKITR